MFTGDDYLPSLENTILVKSNRKRHIQSGKETHARKQGETARSPEMSR